MKDRQTLVDALSKKLEEEKEIRKELNALDYQLRLNEANELKGKFFKQIEVLYEELVQCFFVYSVNKESCAPESISVRYVTNQRGTCSIEHTSSFYPKKWGDEKDYIEITKQEFDNVYSEALKLIGLSYSCK